jgi:heme exporter protein B
MSSTVGPAWFEIARRDLLLAYRRRAEAANPLLFLLIVVALFPLGIGPAPEQLSRIAPGVVWVTALLASLLSTDMVFRSDFDDGSLEQIARSPSPLYATALAKMGVHWLVSGCPIALASPLLAGLLYLPSSAMWALLLSMLLGTVSLSMVGGIGAALTVGLRKGGLLLSLLVLPLYVPVLVFGSAAVDAAANGLPWQSELGVLAGFALLSVTLAPLAAAAALRINLDS